MHRPEIARGFYEHILNASGEEVGKRRLCKRVDALAALTRSHDYDLHIDIEHNDTVFDIPT